jgi:hypothetical protein
MSITFSTCFYILNSKFSPDTYVRWMNNLMSIVNNFNLVIYTDENSKKYINKNNKNNIKIIIRPIEDFYNYKYKDFWIKNHAKNTLLNTMSCWELNMLWSEKIQFVKYTIEQKYFETELYGWCDIGYFRNNNNDIHTNDLQNWANSDKINKIIDKTKISYAMVNNNDSYINMLHTIINNKNEQGLPVNNIPPEQVSIAGGFFIINKNNIEWWSNTYDEKLKLYFNNDYLVKDDQIIIVDCILSNIKHFQLFREADRYDNWFMFQRILL